MDLLPLPGGSSGVAGIELINRNAHSTPRRRGGCCSRLSLVPELDPRSAGWSGRHEPRFLGPLNETGMRVLVWQWQSHRLEQLH